MWHPAVPCVSFAKYEQTSSAAWDISGFFSQRHLCASHWLGTERSQSSARKQAAKPGFQFTTPASRHLEPATSCLLSLGSLAFELMVCREGLEVFLHSLTCSGWVVLFRDVWCSWEPRHKLPCPSQRSAAFLCLLEEVLLPGPRPTALRDTNISQDAITTALLQAPMFRRGMKLQVHSSQCLTSWLYGHCEDPDLSLFRMYDPRHPCSSHELHLQPWKRDAFMSPKIVLLLLLNLLGMAIFNTNYEYIARDYL